MTAAIEVDYILDDCFLAVGQAIGRRKQLDRDVLAWWRGRYREDFLRAMTVSGNSWADDRDRLRAVGRYLGERAVHHARDKASVDLESAARASAEVEAGCRMSRERKGA